MNWPALPYSAPLHQPFPLRTCIFFLNSGVDRYSFSFASKKSTTCNRPCHAQELPRCNGLPCLIQCNEPEWAHVDGGA